MTNMNELVIPFENDLSRENEQLLYVGNKSRYSTMTSVVLLDDHVFACANYYMRELYIVEFNMRSGAFEVVDRVATCGDLEQMVPGPTDLMDKRYGPQGSIELLVSNFDQCSLSVFRVGPDFRIAGSHTIVNDELGWCHGIAAFPGDANVVVFTTSGTTNPNAGIYFLRYPGDERVFLQIREPAPWKPKDICFAENGVMYAVFCNGAPKSQLRPIYSTKVVRYEIDVGNRDFRKTAEKFLDDCHVDACKFFNGRLYVAGERMDDDRNGGIFVFDTRQNGNITLERVIDGFAFPHGLDIGYGLLAVASYGSSDIRIRHFER